MTTITPQQYAQLTALGFTGKENAQTWHAAEFLNNKYCLHIIQLPPNDRQHKWTVSVLDRNTQHDTILYSQPDIEQVELGVLACIDFCIAHIRQRTVTLHTVTECQAAISLSQRLWATYSLLSPSDVEFFHNLSTAIETFKNKHS